MQIVCLVDLLRGPATADASVEPAAEMAGEPSLAPRRGPAIAEASVEPAAEMAGEPSLAPRLGPATADASVEPAAEMAGEPSLAPCRGPAIADASVEPATEMAGEPSLAPRRGPATADASVEPAAGGRGLYLHKELVCAVDKNYDAILDMQRKLDVLIQKSQSNGQRSGQQTDELQTKVTDTLFRSCRSVSTLKAAADGHLVSLPERNMLYCDLCVPAADKAPKRAAGTFKYNFSCGVNFPVGKKMHQKFKSLKTAVSAHFEFTSHITHARQVTRENAQQERLISNRSAIAERVLRAAYHTIMESASHLSFEQLMVMLKDCGVDVGDKNHSTRMMCKARDVFHDVILDKLAAIIKNKPYVAVMADKVTLHNRTVDITAINLVMPDAPSDVMLQNFVISARRRIPRWRWACCRAKGKPGESKRKPVHADFCWTWTSCWTS